MLAFSEGDTKKIEFLNMDIGHILLYQLKDIDGSSLHNFST